MTLLGYWTLRSQGYHGAPICRCGSRRTQRIGDSALQRLCHSCGHTYAYRLRDGLLVPLTLPQAEAMEALK